MEHTGFDKLCAGGAQAAFSPAKSLVAPGRRTREQMCICALDIGQWGPKMADEQLSCEIRVAVWRKKCCF
jgi:hypothetical protein